MKKFASAFQNKKKKISTINPKHSKKRSILPSDAIAQIALCVSSLVGGSISPPLFRDFVLSLSPLSLSLVVWICIFAFEVGAFLFFVFKVVSRRERL